MAGDVRAISGRPAGGGRDRTTGPGALVAAASAVSTAVTDAEVALVAGIWTVTCDDVTAALLLRSCFEGAWFPAARLAAIAAGERVPLPALTAHVRVLASVVSANAGLEFVRVDATEYLGRAVHAVLDLAGLAVTPEGEPVRAAAVAGMERLRVLARELLEGPWSSGRFEIGP
jgi:hypothetical protein